MVSVKTRIALGLGAAVAALSIGAVIYGATPRPEEETFGGTEVELSEGVYRYRLVPAQVAQEAQPTVARRGVVIILDDKDLVLK